MNKSLMDLLEGNEKAREEVKWVETTEEFRQFAAKNGFDYSEIEAEEGAKKRRMIRLRTH